MSFSGKIVLVVTPKHDLKFKFRFSEKTELRVAFSAKHTT